MDEPDRQLRVTTRVTDLSGAVLAQAVALAHSGAAAEAERDATGGDLMLAGHDLPAFGPTRVPALRWQPDSAIPRQHAPTEADAGSPPSPRDETPSGSALSSVDVHAYFAQIAENKHVARSDSLATADRDDTTSH